MFFNTDFLNDGDIYIDCYNTEEESYSMSLPTYYFKIYKTDGESIGFCDLRIGHNSKSFYIGNTGYTILPSFRGRGYGAKALRLMCALAKKHDMSYIIVTAKPDNIASRHTVEKCGGVFIDKRALPAFLTDSYGEGTVMRYKIRL